MLGTSTSWWNSGATNTADCDQPGWPSRYSLGYKAGKLLLEQFVQHVIHKHFVTDTNTQVVEKAEGTYRELHIHHTKS
jgi:hypothetical protein